MEEPAAPAAAVAAPSAGPTAELYTWNSVRPVFAINWSNRQDKGFRLGAASFVEDLTNRVEILTLDEERRELVADSEQSFVHPYPPTKLMFAPDRGSTGADVIATSGDTLRLWTIPESGPVRLDRQLATGRAGEYSQPLTSFDWNEAEPRRIVTCSIDTTATVWDVERGKVEMQLVAHDSEVYDVAWAGAGVFGSAGADGSLRVFDLRDRDHSTIIYESRPSEPTSTSATPLLRLAWNHADPRFLAATIMDSPKVVVLDIRFPTLPIAELSQHAAPANALAWAPHSARHLCTGADDCQALVWDLAAVQGQQHAHRPEAQGASSSPMEPVLCYNAQGEISQLQWSAAFPEWVAVSFGSRVQTLHV